MTDDRGQMTEEFEFVMEGLGFWVGPTFAAQPATRNAQPVLCATTTCSFLPLNPGLDDIGCATDSRVDPNGAGRTILGACAAFHASVKINDFCFFTVYSKYRMGADEFTHTAADTRLRIKLQRRDSFQVSKVLHFPILLSN